MSGNHILPQLRLNDLPIELLFLWHHHYVFYASADSHPIRDLTQQLIGTLLAKYCRSIKAPFCGQVACRHCLLAVKKATGETGALYSYLNKLLVHVNSGPNTYHTDYANERWLGKVIIPSEEAVSEAIRCRGFARLQDEPTAFFPKQEAQSQAFRRGGVPQSQIHEQPPPSASQMGGLSGVGSDVEVDRGDDAVHRDREQILLVSGRAQPYIRVEGPVLLPAGTPKAGTKRALDDDSDGPDRAREPTRNYNSPVKSVASDWQPQEKKKADPERKQPSFYSNPAQWPTDLSRWDE